MTSRREIGGWRRAALSVLGIGIFVLAWHVVVTLGAREVRHETFGIALDGAGGASVVVLDRFHSVAAAERMSLAPEDREAAVETVRVLWGAHQPKLAAVPPGGTGEAAAVEAILEEAKRQLGGGLLVEEVVVSRRTGERAPARGEASGRAGEARASGGPAEGGQASEALAPVPSPPRETAGGEAEARAAQLQEAHRAWRRDLPTPAEALAALSEMIESGVMPRYIVASLFRVGFGFTIAALVGIPFGLALGSLAWFNAVANALIQILRPISPIAWLPVATIMFGGGDQAAVYLIFYCAFFPIAISTAAATATVELRYRRSAMNFGVTGIDLARRLILPAILPSILTALRVAVGVSWLVVVAAEMLGVESGLGYLVLDARNQVRYDRVVAAMMVIGAIGLAIDATMRRIEKAELERRGFTAR